MISTKQVVLVVGLLASLLFWRNLQGLKFLEYPVTENPNSDNRPRIPNGSTDNAGLSARDARSRNETDAFPRWPLPAGASEASITRGNNRLIHVAIYGLGHRLIRTATAWHLAQQLGMTKFKFQWGTCGADHSSGPKIFPYLFGDDDEWAVPPKHSDHGWGHVPTRHNNTKGGKDVLVRNDVYGYLPAQTFRDHRLPLPSKQRYREAGGPFLSKLESDRLLFESLRNRYVFTDTIENFRRQHRWNEHLVIGLHLRAGNGEQTHFNEANRGIANETEFVSNLVGSIRSLVATVHQQQASSGDGKLEKQKPTLIFLATDTAYLIPTFSNLTWTSSSSARSIKTVVLPQIRLADNEGVTFSALKRAGQKCLLGWQAMVSDMILLSHSDVLVAARHSSFTQSLPLSLVLHGKRQEAGVPRFCEASADGASMTCLADLPTWLYRNDPSKVWTISPPFTPSKSKGFSGEAVQHKALVHLPEVSPPKEYPHVVDFLYSSGDNALEDNTATETHTYGKQRFYPKFRNRKRKRKPLPVPAWNFTEPISFDN